MPWCGSISHRFGDEFIVDLQAAVGPLRSFIAGQQHAAVRMSRQCNKTVVHCAASDPVVGEAIEQGQRIVEWNRA